MHHGRGNRLGALTLMGVSLYLAASGCTPKNGTQTKGKGVGVSLRLPVSPPESLRLAQGTLAPFHLGLRVEGPDGFVANETVDLRSGRSELELEIPYGDVKVSALLFSMDVGSNATLASKCEADLASRENENDQSTSGSQNGGNQNGGNQDGGDRGKEVYASNALERLKVGETTNELVLSFPAWTAVDFKPVLVKLEQAPFSLNDATMVMADGVTGKALFPPCEHMEIDEKVDAGRGIARFDTALIGDLTAFRGILRGADGTLAPLPHIPFAAAAAARLMRVDFSANKATALAGDADLFQEGMSVAQKIAQGLSPFQPKPAFSIYWSESGSGSYTVRAGQGSSNNNNNNNNGPNIDSVMCRIVELPALAATDCYRDGLIAALTPGTPYRVSYVISADGFTSSAFEETITVSTQQQDPTNLQLNVDSNSHVIASWSPPSSGPTPTNYYLQAVTGANTPSSCDASGPGAHFEVNSNVLATDLGAYSAGTQVNVKVCSYASSSVSPGTNQSITVPTPVTPPLNPNGLQLSTDANLHVIASWNAPSSGKTPTHYYIQTTTGATPPTSCDAAGPGTHMEVAANNHSADLGAYSAGTQVHVKVCSFTAPNSASPGANQSMTVQAPLSAPGGLAASPRNSQVALTWNTVSGATDYEIRYATGAANPETGTVVSSTGTGTSKTVSALVNGTNYKFVVRAFAGSVAGPFSSVSTATPMSPPRELTTVSAHRLTDTSIALNWTVPSSAPPANQLDTVSFDVHLQSGGTPPANCANTSTRVSGAPFAAAGLNLPLSLTGLASNTNYGIRVCAVGNVLYGLSSSGVTAAADTSTAPPPEASGVTFSGGILSWNSGGGTTSDFRVRKSSTGVPAPNCTSGDVVSFDPISRTASISTATDFTVRICASDASTAPIVSAGVAYTFQSGTNAFNPAYEGPAEAVSPSVSEFHDTWIKLTWGAPTSGLAPTSYVVRYGMGTLAAGCTDGTSVSNADVDFTSRTARVDRGSTTWNANFQVRICSVNGSQTSPGVNLSVSGPSAPASPGNLAAIPYDGKAVVSFDTPTAVQYRVCYRAGSSPVPDEVGTQCTSPQSGSAGGRKQIVLTSLSNGSAYQMVAQAIDNNAYGSPTSSVSVTPQASTLGAPTGVQASSLGSGRVRITWNSVGSATSYRVYTSSSPGISVDTAASMSVTGATTYDYLLPSSAQNNTNYFAVEARSGSAFSPLSSEASALASSFGPYQADVGTMLSNDILDADADGAKLYFASPLGISITQNNGTTWQHLTRAQGLPAGAVVRVSAGTAGGVSVIAAIFEEHKGGPRYLHASLNGGSNWISAGASNGGAGTAISDVMVQGSFIWLATNSVSSNSLRHFSISELSANSAFPTAILPTNTTSVFPSTSSPFLNFARKPASIDVYIATEDKFGYCDTTSCNSISTSSYLDENIKEMSVSGDGAVLFALQSKSRVRRPDGTWAAIAPGQVACASSFQNTLLTCGPGEFKTTDASASSWSNWTPHTSPADYMVRGAVAGQSNMAFVYGNFGIQQWNSSFASSGTEHANPRSGRFDVTEPRNIVKVGTKLLMARGELGWAESDDNGLNWNRSPSIGGEKLVYDAAGRVSGSNTYLFFATGNGIKIRTISGGSSTDSTTQASIGFKSIVTFASAKVLALNVNGTSLALSEDNGQTFNTLTVPFSGHAVQRIIGSENGNAYVATNQGVCYIPAAGSTCSALNLGGSLTVYDIAEDDNTLWIATSSGLKTLPLVNLAESASSVSSGNSAIDSQDVTSLWFNDANGKLFVGTKASGLYQSGNGGTSFTQVPGLTAAPSSYIERVSGGFASLLWVWSGAGLLVGPQP